MHSFLPASFIPTLRSIHVVALMAHSFSLLNRIPLSGLSRHLLTGFPVVPNLGATTNLTNKAALMTCGMDSQMVIRKAFLEDDMESSLEARPRGHEPRENLVEGHSWQRELLTQRP